MKQDIIVIIKFIKRNKVPGQIFLIRSRKQEQGYTRLGPAIRHAAGKLKESKAEKKLLILITDGKPTDLDGYEGKYGISDVKKSCSEAEGSGILPFALTVIRKLNSSSQKCLIIIVF